MKILFFYSNVVEGSRLSNMWEKKKIGKHEMSYNAKEFQEKFKAFIPQLVVLDLEKNEEMVKKINEAIKNKFPQIKRFLIVPNNPDNDFSKWQNSSWMADAYLKSPLDLDFFALLMEDLEKINNNFFQIIPADVPEDNSAQEGENGGE